ncbi:MAG: TRAP transporter substrate-binding protein DctP [Rhodobacteraceae bacterium]|nr:TRAP transporter substrate-binding protein DctP [Paracoccaceae bacterium]
MFNKLTTKLLTAATVVLAATVSTATFSWANPLEMRISLDTGPAHARNKAMNKFVEVLSERAAGQLDVKIYGSAQLFKDRDVAKALRQGGIDMAAPGFWYLGGMVPEATAAMLPVSYGLEQTASVGALDSTVAPFANPLIEAKTRSHVLGGWLVLGGTSYFSVSKKIATHEDISGMKMRVPGGSLIAAQAETLGASTVRVPFSDLPLALSQGTVDGFLSSAESVVSAKLWDAGVKYEFNDNGFYAAYVPLISNAFWDKMSPDLREIVVGAWSDTIGAAREAALASQVQARVVLAEHGVVSISPSQEGIVKWRAKMMEKQDDLVATMKMDTDFISNLNAEYKRLAN